MKNINGLMKHLRASSIVCRGGADKLKLRNIGYYHGYKGYRIFDGTKLKISSISEVNAIYEFDIELKALLYPKLMYIETALKNYCLEILMEETNSESFSKIYDQCFNRYKDTRFRADRNEMLKKKLLIRNTIYSELSNKYKNSKIIKHFYDNDKPVPIWAVFEIITLGQFANIVEILNETPVRKLNSNLNILASSDQQYSVLSKMIFLLKDLRNSVAHNNVIYDARFQSRRVDKNVLALLCAKYKINIRGFSRIEDYILLVVFFLQGLKIGKRKIKKMLTDILEIIDILTSNITKMTASKIDISVTERKIKSILRNI